MTTTGHASSLENTACALRPDFLAEAIGDTFVIVAGGLHVELTPAEAQAVCQALHPAATTQ